MTGKIIKGIAGFYYVDVAGFGIYQCKAKGLFRKEKLKPLVGDEVRIAVTHEQDMEANIEEILPRKSELYRPAVANIDQVVIVMALADPEPDGGVIDRFLIQMEKLKLPAVICFNKSDLAYDEKKQAIIQRYINAGYNVLTVSVKEKKGVDALKELLKGKTSALAGPSGVGKSSLVNLLSSENIMETGEISAKLKRGKNTTRCAMLVVIGENTFICDTPGFTSFEADETDKDALRQYFPEIWKYEGECRFKGCAHIHEPGCAVKEALENGIISEERYTTYVRLYNELKDKEKNKYK